MDNGYGFGYGFEGEPFWPLGYVRNVMGTLLSQAIVSSWERDLFRVNWEESFALLVSM